MIVFKQKQCSTRATQTIFKLKSAGNKVVKAVVGTGKTKTQIAKESILAKNAIRPENIKGKIIGKALDTSRKIEEIVQRPGHAANDAIEFASKKPAAATVYAIWLGKIPKVPGTTAAAMTAEKVAQQIPVYQEISGFTGRLGKLWKRTKASKWLDGITGYDLSNYSRMIPIA